MSSPSLKLLGTALQSVATVCACSGVGAYAKRQGVLDQKAQKVVDKLVASVFLPCLIIGKVMPHMSVETLRLIWPMGVMCIFVVVFGLAAGNIIGRLVAIRHPVAAEKYKGLIMVAIAFPNAFSVPMTLALALGDHPSLVTATNPGGEWLNHRVKMLFLMSYAIWVLARWSIGYPILSGAISFAEWRSKVLNPPVVATLLATVAGLLWSQAPQSLQNNYVFNELLEPVHVAFRYAGRCTVPMILFALGARLVDAVSEVREALRRLGYSLHRTNGTAGTETTDSLPVAPVPSALGMPDDPEFHGENGKATSRVDVSGADRADADTSQTECRMPIVAHVAVLISRQILGPFFGAAVACGLLRNLCNVSDRVVLLVSFLQSAGPPMINLSVMAGLSGNAEVETSKLLLLTYCASLFTWTASIAFFLWLLA